MGESNYPILFNSLGHQTHRPYSTVHPSYYVPVPNGIGVETGRAGAETPLFTEAQYWWRPCTFQVFRRFKWDVLTEYVNNSKMIS